MLASDAGDSGIGVRKLLFLDSRNPSSHNIQLLLFTLFPGSAWRRISVGGWPALLCWGL